VTATVNQAPPAPARPPAPTRPPAPRANRPSAGGVANLALVLLTLAATFGLARLFTRPLHFFAPVAVVAVAVHVTAWACRRANVTLPGAAIASALVAVLLTSWVALGHTTAYGIPWRGTYHALGPALRAAGDAYRTTSAPTAVISGFVLAGAVGAACVAFLSDWAAFRMRATTEAVLPSFSLFVLSAALAQGHAVVGAGALWLGALLVFLLVRQAAVESPTTAWFASRSRRGPTSVLALGGAMIVVTVVLAVAIGPHLPGATVHPMINWRHSGNGQGSGGRNTGSPLVDITARLQSLDQTEVFTVQTTQPSYLRITALSTFNGTGWSLDDTYRPVHGTLPTADSGANALPPDADTTETVTATVRVSALDSLWLPAAYRPFRVTGVSGLSFSAAAGSIITNKQTSDGLVYTVTSHVPSPTTGELAASGWADRASPDLKKYLELPASVPHSVQVLAQAHTEGAQNPYQAAIMLQDWLRSPPFTYSLNVPADQSANALVDFLTRTKAGFCQQFAAAYAVLGRELGLPTRVAVGFTQGTPDSGGVYHVTDADAHAWPEVWFNGVGWVAFEPTPGRGSPDPSAQAITGVPAAQAPSPTTPTTTPGATTVAPGATTTAPPHRPEPGPITTTAPAHRRSWVVGAGITLASIAGAALLWAFGLAVAGWVLASRRRRHARSPAARVTLAWSLAREALGSAGLPARPSETPTEFAERVGRSAAPEGAAAAVARLAELEERASYSPFGPADGDDDAAGDAAAEVLRAAAAMRGRWGDLGRLWDPRPVLAVWRAERDEARSARELPAPAELEELSVAR
jgi:transglutaminase-like putative cysteine protease